MAGEKFTAGPWRYQEESDAYTHIVRAGTDEYICGCGQGADGECEANARLIAAAPDLYAALNRLLVHWIGVQDDLCPECCKVIGTKSGCDTCYVVSMATAALARARGQQG